ncbi:MAG: hypothetical protein ABI047_06840 [Jatrophihabitantaceae bacterium]
MSAPRGKDLERRLTELLQQRAATVTKARSLPFEPAEKGTQAAEPRPARIGTLRENLGLLAVAAVVLVAIAGTVQGIREFHQWQVRTAADRVYNPSPKPSASITTAPGTPCVATASTSWRQAITAGAVPVDRTFNTVVSANGSTGDYLVVQGNEPPPQTSAIYSDIEVALFRGSRGVTIYTPEGSDIPHADPTGAISADWVTFAVARPQNLNSYKVMLYDRGAGVTRPLAEMPQQQGSQGRSVLGVPVIAAGKVYWLSTVYNKPETTTLESWDLARNSAGGSVPAAGATGLVSYGVGVAQILEGVSEATLINGAGVPLYKAQLDAAVGSNFGFDGRRTLSYLRHEGSGTDFYTLTSFGSVSSHGHGALDVDGSFAGAAIPPFLATEANSRYSLFDMRNGGRIRLPEGVSLQAVVGDEVIFGTGTTKSGAAGLSRVALTRLPPVNC